MSDNANLSEERAFLEWFYVDEPDVDINVVMSHLLNVDHWIIFTYLKNKFEHSTDESDIESIRQELGKLISDSFYLVGLGRGGNLTVEIFDGHKTTIKKFQEASTNGTFLNWLYKDEPDVSIDTDVIMNRLLTSGKLNEFLDRRNLFFEGMGIWDENMQSGSNPYADVRGELEEFPIWLEKKKSELKKIIGSCVK